MMDIHGDPALRRIKFLEEENERLRVVGRRIQAACTMAGSAVTIQELAIILDEITKMGEEL